MDREISIDQILVTGDEGLWKEKLFSETKKKWTVIALTDTTEHLNKNFPGKVSMLIMESLSTSLCKWANEHKLQQVVAYRPEVGFIASQIPAIRYALSEIGVRLVLLEHQEDQDVREYAKSGFFSFWKEIEPFVHSLKV